MARHDLDVQGLWSAARPPTGLRYSDDMQHGLVNEGTLWLDVPLIEGKIFGEFANTTRGRYCWVVLGEDLFNIADIKGVPQLTAPRVFNLTFRTSPDHVVMRFVPGLGIAGYQYVHHGTTAECDMTLVEFGAAKSR